MEQYLSLFVRSVFLENMALYYGYVYLFSGIEKGENRDGFRGRGDCGAGDFRACESTDLCQQASTRCANVGRLSRSRFGFLNFLTFIGVIAALVQILEMVLDTLFPAAV